MQHHLIYKGHYNRKTNYFKLKHRSMVYDYKVSQQKAIIITED